MHASRPSQDFGSGSLGTRSRSLEDISDVWKKSIKQILPNKVSLFPVFEEGIGVYIYIYIIKFT